MFDSEFERGLFELRQQKLRDIEALGQSAYPNRFPALDAEPPGIEAAAIVHRHAVWT